MRVILISVSTVFASLTTSLSAQLFEHTDQLGAVSSYTNAILASDSLWVVSNKRELNGAYEAVLEAFDFSGNSIWQYDAVQSGEVVTYMDLAEVNANHIVALALSIETCDVPEPIFRMDHIDHEGNLMMSTPLPTGEFTMDGELYSDGGLIFYAYKEGDTSVLMTFDSSGEALWSATLEAAPVVNIFIQNEVIYVFLKDRLHTLELDGSPLNTLTYQNISNLRDAALQSNGDFALLGSSILELYNSDYDLVNDFEFEGGAALKLALDANGYTAVVTTKIYQFDNALDVLDQYNFDIADGFAINDVALSPTSILLAGAKISEPVWIFGTHQYATLQTVLRDGTQLDHFPDLEVTSVDDIVTENSTSSTGTYYTGHANVTVTNVGDTPVDNFYLNYLVASGMCAPFAKSQYYSDVTLMPGDATTVNFNGIQGFAPLISPFSLALCVFVTSPDNLIDRTLANDRVCQIYQIIVSASELNGAESLSIFPNPVHEKLNIRNEQAFTGLNIYSLDGRKILSYSSIKANAQLDVASLSKGLYLLEATSESGSLIQKFAKE